MLVSPTPTTKDDDNLRQQLLEGMEEGTLPPVINTTNIGSISKRGEEDDNDEDEDEDNHNKVCLFSLVLAGMASGIFYHILLLWLYMMKISRDPLYHAEPISDTGFQGFAIIGISCFGFILSLHFFVLLVIFNIIKRIAGRNTFEDIYYFAFALGYVVSDMQSILVNKTII